MRIDDSLPCFRATNDAHLKSVPVSSKHQDVLSQCSDQAENTSLMLYIWELIKHSLASFLECFCRNERIAVSLREDRLEFLKTHYVSPFQERISNRLKSPISNPGLLYLNITHGTAVLKFSVPYLQSNGDNPPKYLPSSMDAAQLTLKLSRFLNEDLLKIDTLNEKLSFHIETLEQNIHCPATLASRSNSQQVDLGKTVLKYGDTSCAMYVIKTETEAMKFLETYGITQEKAQTLFDTRGAFNFEKFAQALEDVQ